MNVTDMTLCALSSALKSKKVSSVEATSVCLKVIGESSELNNFITVTEDEAIAQARLADERISSGDAHPLCGVPIAVKDNISTKDIRTTCASKFLDNYIPAFDATVVEKLKAAGAVILGKTNMDEFAMGSTNETSAFGVVRNVHDTERVPGGSSGGSGNCVAARQAFGALGSDTGGSIRQPAAYCGVVGLKPTYSAVSRYGLIAFASSFDQIGTLTRDCDDALALLKTVAGRDERDSTSSGKLVLPSMLDGVVSGMTVGVCDEFFKTDKLDSGVYAQYERAVDVLRRKNVKVKKISLPTFGAALAVYYVLSCAEASSNLARFDGIKYGMRASSYKDLNELVTNSRTEFFGAEVKRRIMTGTFVLSEDNYEKYYVKAAKVRTVMKAELAAALCCCDAIISPTTPYSVPKLGEQSDPKETYVSDMYTVPANITGLPALGVPFGTSNGMPVGVQFIGSEFSEGKLLNFGKALMAAAC